MNRPKNVNRRAETDGASDASAADASGASASAGARAANDVSTATAGADSGGFADFRYPVYETFHSWQGEGDFAGRSAFFIRLFGCPVRCEWCDSRGTWDAAFAPAEIPRIPAARLAEMARQSRADFAVVTGGEPAIHDLAPLADALAGMPLHIETCGAFPLRLGANGGAGGGAQGISGANGSRAGGGGSGRSDARTGGGAGGARADKNATRANAAVWVTVSPKQNLTALPENLRRADEIKLVLSAPADLPRWHGILRAAAGARPFSQMPSIWLHPEWSRHDDAALLSAITRWVRHCGSPYRAGWQIHKCYNADPPPPPAASAKT